MQKIIQRAKAADHQALRRQAAKAAQEFKADRKVFRQQLAQQNRSKAAVLKEARLARHQDWDMGPLAPNRAFGKDKDTFGALEQIHIAPIEIPEKMRRKQWNIVEGDRVVLLSGRDKGKIGMIKTTWKESDRVSVEGLNQAYMKSEEWQRQLDGNPSPISTTEIPVYYDEVRLVQTIRDPRTHQLRDVVVDEIEVRNFRRNKHTREETWDRFIPSTDIEIPWPAKGEPEHTDHEDDTLRITTEERSFVPTLLIPPFPETVIDELRGKYSKFRTRHDEDYVERKMKEDEEAEARKKLAIRMRTPLQEFHIGQNEEKARKGEPQLTEDMLARIGEVIAANKAGQQNATA
ncbi:hypothetical protein AOQ84DRAFT_306900 [Glonium stellatum]|uniref:KOW domain-containing protein n=1 Tax=Glonium stellatum TaxID=574774 RepID=A0A8E2JLB7_9PEZI|nr:hypothetical protein AOQ84DRAFT_306900 [Glonium stellatum]